jgi:signal transduction histidine kinase
LRHGGRLWAVPDRIGPAPIVNRRIVVSADGQCFNATVSNLIRQALRRTLRLAEMLVLAAVVLFPAVARSAALDLSAYTYEDTKRVVTLVDDAATLVEQKGEAAFDAFRARGTYYWPHPETYVFVYAMDGTCIFHAAEPSLVGQNRMDLQDIEGRRFVRAIVELAGHPAPNASGWVFYLGQDRASLTPTWKANYIRKVIAPDHKIYALGAGLFNPKIERLFVQQNVDEAVELLARDGKAALTRLQDPIFTVLDSYIFVMDARGQTLVDPIFPTQDPRDLWDFTDATGAYTVRDILGRLATTDSVWMPYLMPPPGSRTPARKLMYVRKVTVNGETLFVGSDYFVTTPIWMRSENDGSWQRVPPT